MSVVSIPPSIEDFGDPTWDPHKAFDDSQGEHLTDTYARIEALWREAPVHEGEYRVLMGLSPEVTLAGPRHFTVFGHDLVQQVYSDPEVFSNRALARLLGPGFGRTVSTMDGVEHTRYRRLFQRAFMPNVVAGMSNTFVQPVVDDLIGPIAQRGKADLVAEFTQLFPFHIIYRQLGLPPDDIAVFHKLAVTLTVSGDHLDKAIEASRKLGAYYEALTEHRYAHPGDDLISTLTQIEVEGDRLPKDVLVSFLRQLINAAGDTTYRSTSSLLAALLTHPEQFDAVRRDRSLIPQAIEETLRWEGPVIIGFRETTRNTELGGMKIPAGSIVHVCNGSASRDPSRYENPHAFNIFRPIQTRHMAFAYGAHVCVGQHLARLEMTRALNAVLDRLPNLRLDPDMPPPHIRGANMRMPAHLHVVFG